VSEPEVRHERIGEGRGEDPYLYVTKLYHWEPDQEISEIVIRGEAPIDMRTVGKKPAITVVLGPTSYRNLGIDNMLSYNQNTGERVRTDMMMGNLVVYVLAFADIIALRIAHIVAHHTRAQQRLLESPGGFHSIGRPFPQVNSPSPPGALVAGDPEGLVMVQVNIPFEFQWTWSTTPRQSQSLRSLDLITSHERASDYPYASLPRLERVELAMSTSPVLVRRISGRYALRPVTVQVTEGISPFQVSGLRPFGDEE
jgi:hypothetical protein